MLLKWIFLFIFCSMNFVLFSIPHTMHFQNGETTIHFPSPPTHQRIILSNETNNQKIQYDAYTSHLEKDGKLFLFVMKYPQSIQSVEKKSVYGAILKSFMFQHSMSQMVYIKKIPNFHEGIEFLIESRHTFYQGRAFIVKDHVYLIVMQCRSVREQQKLFMDIMNKIRVR